LLTTLFRWGLQGLLAGRPWKGGKGGGYLGVTSGLSRKRARLGTPNSLGVSELSDLTHLTLPGPGLPGPCPRLDQDFGLAAPRPLEPLYPNLLIMKGDAQKADNAAVPDHLWLGMFASGYGSESFLTRHRLALGRPSASPGGLKEPGPPAKDCGWEKTMAGFRIFGLQHWRRQLLRGFYRCRRENAPHQTHQPTPSQMVRNHKELRAGAVRTIYSWSAKGQQFYTSQWVIHRRSSEGRATVSASLDALRRCANASWFEWLEGSAPIFCAGQ
jgi:hypothetical protein